jgi:hypothetical protein
MEPQDPILTTEESLKFLATELGLFLWMEKTLPPAPESSTDKPPQLT